IVLRPFALGHTLDPSRLLLLPTIRVPPPLAKVVEIRFSQAKPLSTAIASHNGLTAASSWIRHKGGGRSSGRLCRSRLFPLTRPTAPIDPPVGELGTILISVRRTRRAL